MNERLGGMKRTHEFSPSGLTPKSKSRQRERVATRAAKTLFPCSYEGRGAQHPPAAVWSLEEEEALLVFLSKQQATRSPPEWPTFNDKRLWLEASEAVSDRSSKWLAI